MDRGGDGAPCAVGGRAGFLLCVAGRGAREPVAAYITAASCSGARFVRDEATHYSAISVIIFF
jgi:hypothetical protein